LVRTLRESVQIFIVSQPSDIARSKAFKIAMDSAVYELDKGLSLKISIILKIGITTEQLTIKFPSSK